jgi:pimeloyl-ACP methyl ester carboxylesterase
MPISSEPLLPTLPAGFSRQKLDLQPYPAAYLEQGQGKETIVFLHGFLGEASNWLPMIRHLPDVRCIAIDLLGFGASAKPDLRYTIWHQVAFVEQVITALQLEQFWLVGHSYGGWTAAAYGIAAATGQLGLAPDGRSFCPASRLQGLGLVAPAGIRDDQFVGRYAHLRPLLWETVWVDRALNYLVRPLCRAFGQQATFAQICQFREAIAQQPVAKSFLRDRLRPEDAIDTVETQLSQIQVPTIIFAGGVDETIPLWHCQTYATGIPTVQYQVFEAAGHDLNQSCAQAIAQQLRARLNDA